MATTTHPDAMVQRAKWDLQKYEISKAPDQRSIRTRLLNMAGDLEAKRDKKQARLEKMYAYMSDEEKWASVDQPTQDQRYKEWLRLLSEYEQLSDCVREIAALR